MSSGRMTKELFFQTKSETADDGGGVAVTYTDSFSLFGMIEPRSGKENFFAMRLQGDVTHIITVRYNLSRSISVDDRIQYRPSAGTRTFNIKSVLNPDERNRYYRIAVVEGEAT